MKRRVISALLAATMVAAMTAGCKETEETKKHRKKATEPEESTVETSDEEDEAPADNGEGASSDSDITQDTILDPDQVAFTYECYNYAWGETASILVIMGDGRVYVFENKKTSYSYVSGADRDAALLGKIGLLDQIEPDAYIDMDYLTEFYEEAMAIDPNATKVEKSGGYDMGQISLYCWTSDGEKVICIQDGDTVLDIDDPHADGVQHFWDDVENHLLPSTKKDEVKFYSDLDMAIDTYHCGYVDLPADSTGHYIFTSYEDLASAAETWSIDLSNFDFLSADTAAPIFVQFDMVSTGGYNFDYDGVALQKHTFYFLPSDECSSPAPDTPVPQMMDGFVTICVYTGELDLDNATYTSTDGQEWVLWEAES